MLQLLWMVPAFSFAGAIILALFGGVLSRRMVAIVGVGSIAASAAILFTLGLAGLLARRNVIFTLMSIEVMLNAAGLGFVSAGARWGQADGQVMFLFILAMAAAEVSVGLALVLRLYHLYKSLDVDAFSLLKG